MLALLLADELPQDVVGAEAVLASHSEHKMEIDAREASFNAFKSNGSSLIAANHYASKEVRLCINNAISTSLASCPNSKLLDVTQCIRALVKKIGESPHNNLLQSLAAMQSNNF